MSKEINIKNSYYLLTNSEKNVIYKKFNIQNDAISGFTGNLDILIKLNISLETPLNSNKDNPITICCKHGSKHFLEKLLKNKVNINYTNKQGQTGLMLASAHNKPFIVSKLLENGADITLKDENNKNTAIMYACMYGNLECSEKLLENGACLEDVGENGYTPFLMAVQHGNLSLVNFLVDKIDIDYVTEISNETALMIAARKGYLDIVKLLVKKGANVFIKEKFDGFTAEQIALYNNNLNVVLFFKTKKRKRDENNTSSKRKK